MWEFYLCYCEGGFAERALSDVQIVLQDTSVPARPIPRVPRAQVFMDAESRSSDHRCWKSARRS
jgi:hypothetical protein